MYVHLGNGIVARQESIVAVFDLDNSSQSHITRKYLTAAEKSGRVVNVAPYELPKSFVVCNEEGGQRVYICQVNSSTILKRAENVSFE